MTLFDFANDENVEKEDSKMEYLYTTRGYNFYYNESKSKFYVEKNLGEFTEIVSIDDFLESLD